MRRTFRTGVGLVEHLQINCIARTSSTVFPAASTSSSTPPTNTDSSPEPPPPSSSSCPSSSAVSAPVVVAPAKHTNTAHNLDTSLNINTTAVDTRGEDQDYTCPHCDRAFTSHIGLVGHLRIHQTETSEPVPEAPIFARRTCLHCPHCPRTFTHRMGLSATYISTRTELPAVPSNPPRPVPPSLCHLVRPSSSPPPP
nr:unnamed protein product [Spirometra erinaceieuropaei]